MAKRTFFQNLGYIFNPPDARGVGLLDRCVLTRLGVDNAWQARPEVPAEKHLIDSTAALSRRMGIATPPKVLLYDSAIPNAASLITGSLLVATNLMDIMTPGQVDAVMGHELSHHRHRGRDVPVTLGLPLAYDALTLGVGWKNLGVMDPKSRLAFSTISSIGVGATNIVIPRAWQRNSEYEADWEGATATGRPGDMAGALEALGRRIQQLRLEAAMRPETKSERPLRTAPHAESIWERITRTHPPMSSRIARMRQLEKSMSPSSEFKTRLERAQSSEEQPSAPPLGIAP